MTDQGSVKEFLGAVAGAISLGHCCIRDRQKNRQGLIELNLTEDMAWELIGDLEVKHYSAGPKPDDTDDSKDIWVFGCDVVGIEAYIKLRLAAVPGRKTVQHLLVWSIHPAEHPLSYPLRRGNT